MLLNRPQFQLQIWEKIFNLKKKNIMYSHNLGVTKKYV